MENDDPLSPARIRDSLGRNVRKIRKEAGLTQADLARRLVAYDVDLHQSTIAKLEAGTRPAVAHEIWALASVLEVEYDDLLPRRDGWTGALPQSEAAREAAHRNRVLEEALGAARARMEADQAALLELEMKVRKSREEVDALRANELPEDLKRRWQHKEAAAREKLKREAAERDGVTMDELHEVVRRADAEELERRVKHPEEG